MNRMTEQMRAYMHLSGGPAPMILEEGYDFMTIPADLEWGLTDETVMLKGDGPAPVEEYVEMAQSTASRSRRCWNGRR
jgi:hypothetical protein